MGWLDNIFGFLGGVGNVGLSLASVFQWVVEALSAIGTVLLKALLEIGGFLLNILKSVGKFFQLIWDKFFKGIFSKLVNALLKAHDWLEAHLRPLLNFLQKVRKYLDRIYFRYIKPFLDLIQHVRRFLLILKLLHVKFAQELDAQLASIQHSVQSAFLEARTLLNGIIDVVNLIVDPSALLRKPTLILSMRRSIGAIIRVVTGLPPAFFFPSPRKNAPLGWAALPSNFDPRNLAHNPPPSFYLQGDEGLGAFSFIGNDAPLPDSAVDDIDMLDFFADEYYPAPICTNPAECLRRIRARQIMELENARA